MLHFYLNDGFRINSHAYCYKYNAHQWPFTKFELYFRSLPLYNVILPFRPTHFLGFFPRCGVGGPYRM